MQRALNATKVMQVEGSRAAFAEGIERGALRSGLLVRARRLGQPALGGQIGLPSQTTISLRCSSMAVAWANRALSHALCQGTENPVASPEC